MSVIYYCAIKIYYLLIFLVSFFNSKANLWILGRRNWRTKFKKIDDAANVWFHFASLGEFEQGKPLLKEVRSKFPQRKIIITFFSPSGYEIRKNSPLGDYILYLPLDTPQNATDFIELFKPSVAIFNKYEYWYNFFKALKREQIPIYVTSAIFRADQVYFKWYGGFNQHILMFVTRFFVQNKESGMLLEHIGLTNYSIAGDTRFDSVLDLSLNKKDFPLIKQFINGRNVLIAGSTWLPDEKLLKEIDLQDWCLIIAPHEISEHRITEIETLFLTMSIRYSLLHQVSQEVNQKVLIIDNIGMLSSLYAMGDVAYIGGGFGVGIHNTLEAAAWGIPVLFGPNYQKFDEAKQLIKVKAAFSFQDDKELKAIFNQLLNDQEFRVSSGKSAKKYVHEHTGASALIMKSIFDIN